MSKHGPLTIRDAQLSMFRQLRVAGFIDNLVAYFAGEYPSHAARLGAEGLRTLVERSIEAADTLGIRLEGAVGAFIELKLIYGENLERSPDREWARNILAHPTLPDYIKVGAVQDRLSERAGGRVLVVHQEPA